jgi:hypothetical protein
MTNVKSVTEMMKDMAREKQTPNKTLGYNPETKRLEVVDADQADKKDLLKVSPEDMIVSATFDDLEG